MSSSKKLLDSFERSKILEIYFSRIDGRPPVSEAPGYESLYSIDLVEMKNYLLGQETKDCILPKVLNITEPV